VAPLAAVFASFSLPSGRAGCERAPPSTAIHADSHGGGLGRPSRRSLQPRKGWLPMLRVCVRPFRFPRLSRLDQSMSASRAPALARRDPRPATRAVRATGTCRAAASMTGRRGRRVHRPRVAGGGGDRGRRDRPQLAHFTGLRLQVRRTDRRAGSVAHLGRLVRFGKGFYLRESVGSDPIGADGAPKRGHPAPHVRAPEHVTLALIFALWRALGLSPRPTTASGQDAGDVSKMRPS
jgi:hypothetical protein